MLITREILGIYFSEDSFEAVRLRKKGNSWEKDKTFSPEVSPGAPIADRLKGLLQSIRPSMARKIVLGLPRKAFFLRELSYPQLDMDEAENAVHLGIGIHTHLDSKDIFFDTSAFKRSGQTVVLLAYIPKVFLEPVFKIFKDTGHRRSLSAVSPAFLGFDVLLRKTKATPCMVLGKQGKSHVISLHGRDAWEGSHLLSGGTENGKEDINTEMENILSGLPNDFHSLMKEEIWGLETEGVYKDPCSGLKDASLLCGSTGKLTWGVCSALIGLKSYPSISFQEKKRRKPVFSRVKPFQVIAAVVVIMMILATLIAGIDFNKKHKKLSTLKKEKRRIEKSLAPILDAKAKLEEINKKNNEIEEFRSGSPQILSIIYELAVKTPKDTWIRSFNFKNKRLILIVESDSAAKAMETWRRSETLSRLRMTSPVTKNRKNKEGFSVEITFGQVDSRGEK